jgi:predicted nucleotidyltransferase
LSFGALPFERELIDRANETDVRGTSVKVATPEDLIITKAVANRPKDIADIELIVDVRKRLDLRRIRYWVVQFADALEMPEIMENVERVLEHCTTTRSSVRSKKTPGQAKKKNKR